MAEPEKHPNRWWTLAAVCVATFMLLIDITVVNVALPDIAKDLKTSFSDLQWVVDAYALGLASLLLTTGTLADRFGHRRIFVAGLIAFTSASILCGLATSPLFLILARGFQGIGGAAMFATSLSLIAHAFSGPDRGTAFGIWGATIGAAVAIGPLVGGVLTEQISWESIFFVHVPIGIAAVAATLAKVDEFRSPSAHRIDAPGLVTFSGGLFLLILALVRGNAEGWGSTLIVALLIGAGVLLALFVVIERRAGEDAMFDLSLFRKPAFGGASIAAFGLSASMFSMFLYITLYIQNTLGFSPQETGLRFLPLTVVSFFVAPAAGRISRTVPVRVLFGVGMTLVGVGLLLMSGIDADSKWTALLPGFVLAGAGVGMVNPSLAQAAVGVVTPQRSGMASGINSTFRQVGIATGIAALGAVFQGLLTSKIARVPGDVLATGYPNLVRGVPRHEYLAAYSDALSTLFLITAIVAFVCGALALALTRQSDFIVHGTPQAEEAAREAEPAASG
jgi:EmrB/QacA subfamily drug resistance transporter